MTRYATLKDVAKLAGTTAATVSYVLNERKGRYISKETKLKVQDAAKRLDYIKCNRASSLKGKNSKLIAILVPQFENQFFTRIILGAEEVFVKHGYDMIICNTLDKPERELDIIQRMLQQRVDGILLAPTIKGMENTASLRRLGIKMVAVDRPLDYSKKINSVLTANYEGAFLGAAYLMEKGHQKIAYIGWKSQIADLDKRCQAVLDAAKQFEIPENNITIKEGLFSADEGHKLTYEVLDSNPEVSAFFYGFNVQALGGIRCLKERGIDVPQSKSVLLIGSPEWAITGGNNFTHVDMCEYMLGKNSAEILMEMLQNPESEKVKHITGTCSLIEGNSVSVQILK